MAYKMVNSSKYINWMLYIEKKICVCGSLEVMTNPPKLVYFKISVL